MLKEFKDFVMRGNVLDLAVAVIIGGELKQVGKAEQIKDKPADSSVRDFVRAL
mgnify:CR=1 FL=1